MTDRCVAVAHSGGRDSTALLHVTLRHAAQLGYRVVALHVHHGLLPQADAWLAHVQRQCERWADAGFPLLFKASHLTGRPSSGESTEAWARRERYAALSRMAQDAGASLVLLAHHRRDQAETVLLQALRGGGAAGLAAMPALIERHGLQWARPWLGQPREIIDGYVRRHGLRFVEDPSNADPRFARNRIRMAVWPALASAFGDAELALAAVAQRAHEAAECQRALADIDMAAVVDGNQVIIGAWSGLTAARRSNVLRAWLHAQCGSGVRETLVRRLMVELLTGTGPASWPVPAGSLRRYQGRLTWSGAEQQGAGPPSSRAQSTFAPSPLVGLHVLSGWGGALRVDPVDEDGLPAPWLSSGLRLARREGGEKFQSHAKGIPRSLKKQFQAVGVPLCMRSGPLLYRGDDLVFVAGLGIDSRYAGGAGERQYRLTWVPDDGSRGEQH